MEWTSSPQWPAWLQVGLSLVGFIIGVVVIERRFRKGLQIGTGTAENAPKAADGQAAVASVAGSVTGPAARRILDSTDPKPPLKASIISEPRTSVASPSRSPVTGLNKPIDQSGHTSPTSAASTGRAGTAVTSALTKTTTATTARPKPVDLNWFQDIVRRAPPHPLVQPFGAGLEQGLTAKPIRFTPNGRFSKLGVGDSYPITEMPVSPSISAGTLPGRSGARGYSEVQFFGSLKVWFKTHLRRDDRMAFAGASRDYEPDIILHFEDRALRIDIEIDEPYSGATRKPMHCLDSYDDDRDLYFSKNGWVVIRFAEVQVMQQRAACIKHVAQVIDSLLNTTYASRMAGPVIERVSRWSHAQAAQWARDRFRERYLGVEFERRTESHSVIEIEQDVVRTRPQGLQGPNAVSFRDTGVAKLSPKEQKLKQQLDVLIANERHIRFSFDGEMRLMKPARVVPQRARHVLQGHDLVLRENQEYELRRITKLEEERAPIVKAAKEPSLTELKEAVAYTMDNQLYLQITYTNFDGVIRKRTLSNLQYTNDFDPFGYEGEHIKAYCSFRKEERPFKIQRIREYAILKLSYAPR